MGAYKKKQMLPGGSKTRSALQSGYFEPVFKRIMEKEAYSDPVKLRRQLRVAKSKKNIGKAFLPSNYPKKKRQVLEITTVPSPGQLTIFLLKISRNLKTKNKVAISSQTLVKREQAMDISA